MDTGFVVLSTVAAAFLCFWLSAYVYGLYAAGKWLASRYRLKFKPLGAGILVSLLALAVDLPVLPFDLPAVYKLALMLGLWMIHAQPLAIGYWAGYDHQRLLDEERWRQAAEAWVTSFEERPPEIMKDFEESSDE